MEKKKHYDIGIATAISEGGGSTESFVNLCSAFNRYGLTCILLGPHHEHIERCNGDLLKNIHQYTFTNIIVHCLPITAPIPYADNVIYSCHESNIFNLFNNCDISAIDKFHFVSDAQVEYQITNAHTPPLNFEYSIIPNLIDPRLNTDLKLYDGDLKIGGVIGSIDPNKQTHIAIQEALLDGCDKVYVFGNCHNASYGKHVLKYCQDKRVSFFGHHDKTLIYANVSHVYHAALTETWGYIKAECARLGIPYHNTITIHPHLEDLIDGDIVNKWKEILIK